MPCSGSPAGLVVDPAAYQAHPGTGFAHDAVRVTTMKRHCSHGYFLEIQGPVGTYATFFTFLLRCGLKISVTLEPPPDTPRCHPRPPPAAGRPRRAGSDRRRTPRGRARRRRPGLRDELQRQPIPAARAAPRATWPRIAAMGAHAVPITTSILVRDSAEVFDQHALEPEVIAEQARTMLEDITVAGWKVGFLGSAEGVSRGGRGAVRLPRHPAGEPTCPTWAGWTTTRRRATWRPSAS